MRGVLSTGIICLLAGTVENAFAHEVASYHVPFHHALSKRLGSVVNRRDDSQFEWEPIIAQCPSECAVLEAAFGNCRDTNCYCTDAVAVGYRECMVCSIDLVQNPELQADAQQSMDDYEVNCESGGFPVASLSVAVAAPTAQPPAASAAPAVATSWAVAPTSTVHLTASAAPVATAGGNEASTLCSFSTDANSFYGGCSVVLGSTNGAPTPLTVSQTGESTSTASGAQVTAASDPPVAELSGSSSGSASIRTTPVSGSTLITFDPSSTAPPSASGINAQDNTSGGVVHSQVSLPIFTSVVFFVSVMMVRAL